MSTSLLEAPPVPLHRELDLHTHALEREVRAANPRRGILGRILALRLVWADYRRAHIHQSARASHQIMLAEYAINQLPIEAEPHPHAIAALEHLARAKHILNAALLLLAITLTLTLDQDTRRASRNRAKTTTRAEQTT